VKVVSIQIVDPWDLKAQLDVELFKPGREHGILPRSLQSLLMLPTSGSFSPTQINRPIINVLFNRQILKISMSYGQNGDSQKSYPFHGIRCRVNRHSIIQIK
jgi:hypothetical protein